MIEKIRQWWKNQNSTTQAFIFLIVILIIGIIIRWDFIAETVTRSFDFLKK